MKKKKISNGVSLKVKGGISKGVKLNARLPEAFNIKSPSQGSKSGSVPLNSPNFGKTPIGGYNPAQMAKKAKRK